MTIVGSAFDAPVVATYGESDPEAPLVVLLHGRGSNEEEIISLAAHLPAGVAYAAVRAPIAEGGGFAWFANRGIGRPVADSLAQTMGWFTKWLDGFAAPGRPVMVVGFSGGAAFAGGLALSDPARFSGAAVLFGTLPFEADIPIDVGQLTHLPVFVAQGDQDRVIPAELLARTWSYLIEDSGAPVVARRSPGGHGLTEPLVADLGNWIAERMTYVRVRPTPRPGRSGPVSWPTIPSGTLGERVGAGPEVTWSIPQQQVSQNAPAALQERLLDLALQLPGVSVSASRISVPGARALNLGDGAGDPQAFLVPTAREFAHLHPEEDGSLHLALPAAHAGDVVAQGWGRMHPLAGIRLSPGFVMVFGPRDDDELDTVAGIVRMSHAYATGATAGQQSSDHCVNHHQQRVGAVFTHIWSMTFTEGTTNDQRAAFVAAMAKLPSRIEGVQSFRSGVDLGLNPGNSDVVIVAEFADADTWRAYLAAPAHVAFVNDHVTPLCASWGAIQFDASTTPEQAS